MKIAVTYDNGQIFQHFGRTPAFKLYEVTDGAVTAGEVVPTNGTGHGALADMLRGLGADTLICGGIGGGAQAALEAAGIRLFAGAEGDPDEAVRMLLAGTLPAVGEANCDHHHGEEHDCGSHEGHGEEHACCGHGGEEHKMQESACCGINDGAGEAEKSCDCGQENCEGSCEGCAGCGPMLSGKNVGRRVRTHYRGTFNDGTQFDSSYDRGEPLEFICGMGMMIPGFDAAVADMEEGETVEVHLMPEQAYGEVDPEAIFAVEISQLPGSENLSVGDRVMIQTDYGRFPVRVAARDEATVTLDANHEMAGKELNFTIELVEVVE